jgi:pimeloyl-ACP methyl ester carboxylesterase
MHLRAGAGVSDLNLNRNFLEMDFVQLHGMRPGRRLRWLLVLFLLYLGLCSVGGIYLADGSLRPARRTLTDEDTATFKSTVRSMRGELQDVSITTPDQVVLRGWLLRPIASNGNAALVLHGLADNRLGMTGYAELLLAHGYTVLLPDARAHGLSGGELATYGLLERGDIHKWVDFLSAMAHPRCVYGMGESMGAAELLQSLQEGTQFCAVVAESPFSTFREIAYDRMGQPFHAGPWVGRILLRPMVEIAFLRVHWKYGLDMQRVSPEDAVARSHIPVLLIHGQIDRNIPVRHSRAIHGAAPQTVLWEVPGADHYGAIAAAPHEFETRVLGWFDATGEHSAGFP